MEDTLVRFQVAKLAKEKGFSEITKYGYCDDGYESQSNIYSFIDYFAPTQSFLQKYIREKYYLHIAVMPWDKTHWWYQIEDIDTYDSSKGALIKAESEKDKLYNSYEEALEAGLYQTLKLIK